MATMHTNLPAGLPARAVFKPSGLFVALRQLAPAELRDAFMQETVVRIPAPESIIEIPNSELGSLAVDAAPAGLIFHMARCGSTLVSQLLKEHANLSVYSEPLPINEILAPPQVQPRARLVAALRSLAGLFAQHAARPFVIKLSSWNTLFCELVTSAFPDTPWVLCAREPLEIAVSLQAQPPGWLRHGPAATNPFAQAIDPTGRARSPEAYTAQVLAAFCSAAARVDPRRGKMISYEHLPAAVWKVAAPHFGLQLDSTILARMAQASKIHAKSPAATPVAFSHDSDRKRAEASPELRRAIDLIARPEFEQLKRHLA